MDAAQLQQLINAVNAPRPAGAFAITPGQANPGQTIDYSTSSGIKVWAEATESLPFKFSAEGKEVNAFCEQLMKRAENQGWDLAGGNILNIPDSTNTNRNLIKKYGQLTTDNILTHAQGYIFAENRASQNNMQMYNCITNSLSKAGHLKILAEQDKYYVEDPNNANNKRPSGPLLFKLLMQKAVIDTRATASLLRKNLSSLDTHMSVVKSNIEEFNKYVKINYEGLKARGERCDDLMINLFKGYDCASDREFVRYIKQKKDDYNDGADMEPEQLMTLALNKYEDLVKDGQWNAKSAEQEQIVALTAKLDKLQDANLKLAKTLRSGNQSRGSNRSNNSNKTDKSSDTREKHTNKKKPWEWKKTPPKAGEPHSKFVKVKGKELEYHWCDEHPAWVRHKPADCELKKQRAKEQDERGSEDNKSQRKSYQNALQSIITDLEHEE
jgi:hypothetical protein